jgi:beta-glucosidase
VVSFKITTDLLKFYNANMDFVCEPGLFNIMIGTNSEDLQQVDFMVKE